MKELRAVLLKTDYMTDPFGIGTGRTRFGWILESGERDVLQTAYRIVLGASADPARAYAPVYWDSGKAESDDSVHVVYTGPALQSRTRYCWRVKVWDNRNRESEWSSPAFFETALSGSAEWEAKWIEPCLPRITREGNASVVRQTFLGATPKLPPEKRLTPPTLFRKDFSVDGEVKKARLYVTAHGVYLVEINGRRAGDEEFAPGFTPYRKRIDYQTYDITGLLQQGKNAVGAVVADGWWGGRIGLTGDSCQYGDTHAFLAQLEIEYADGRTQSVLTDETFRCSTGSLVYSDIFIGEMADARKEREGWSLPGFNAADWKGVTATDFGYGNLKPRSCEPVKAVEELPAAEILRTPLGETVVDMGVNIAGRIRMTVRGPAGTKVTLEHSETLNEKGNFINNIAGRNKDQTDVYILKGGGEEVFEPRFTYHGFRYVRLTGYPGEPDRKNFTGIVLSSATEMTGEFSTSDGRLNKLQENIVRSQRGNMFSIPTDCPQRERAGWLGDIQVFGATAAFNAGVDAFLSSWLDCVALEQLEDGQVPFIVPYLDAYREQLGRDGYLRTDSSACWGDAAVILPYTLYRKYGDTGILEKQYACMKKWMVYVEKTARSKSPAGYRLNPLNRFNREKKAHQKYLWNTGFHFGDWLIPSKSVSGTAGEIVSALFTKALVAPAYFAYTTKLMAEIAGILGKEGDKKKYEALNASIKKAFALYYLKKNGRLKTDLQGIYVLALRFGLVPEGYRRILADRLAELIKKNGNRLDTGFASVAFLLDVLCENGYRDLAYTLLYQDECPSWLYEVKKGATTVWESWRAIEPDGKVTNMSYNHYAFGCVGDWMYRNIGGITAAAPAYKKITVRPQPDSSLTFAAAKYRSVYGDIVSEWKKEDGRFTLKVKIPCNTAAEICLPDGSRHRTGSGEYTFVCGI